MTLNPHPISTFRSGLNVHGWRAAVEARLLMAGAAVERTPSGGWRIALNDSYLTVADLKHVTERELDRMDA